MDQFYEGLTRGSLQFQLRLGLSNDNRPGFASELRQAFMRQNALYHIFEEFAIERGQHSSRGEYLPGYDSEDEGDLPGLVWTQSRFAAFLSNRLGNDDDDYAATHATRTLWRCFCYNATYPFTDSSADPEEQLVDLDGWTQAIALLATDAVRNVGRSGARLSLYGMTHTVESRKECCWRRFASLSTSSGSGADASAGAKGHDDWRPPDVLDEIARVAACQLPLAMHDKVPTVGEIRPRVQKLVGEPKHANVSIEASAIPFDDMLAVLGAIMQVTTDTTVEPMAGQYSPIIVSSDDSYARVAAAKAILGVGGIHEGSASSFAKYLVSSEKLRSQNDGSAWLFDDKFTNLWRALFSIQRTTPPPSSPSLPPHPPPFVLQALDFLSPFPQAPSARQRRHQSTLICSTDFDSGLSRDEVVKALTWPYGPKLAVIHGITTALASGPWSILSSPRDGPYGQRAIFAVLTSSPLWCTFETGETTDFLVGEAHVLLELAPRPHALWWGTKQTKFADLVSAADDDTSISFGRAVADPDSPACSSGLKLDFGAGVATLCSSPRHRERREDGYVEIVVGPSNGPAKQLYGTQAWQTAVRMQKVEVYSMPGGGSENLAVGRVRGWPS